MDVSNIINLALLFVTALGVAAAAWQANEARTARSEATKAQEASEEARDETRKLAQDANAALQRQADALEEANKLEQAKTAPKPAFSLTQTSKHGFALHNTGNGIAYAARLEGLQGHVILEEAEPRDLRPGDSLHFSAIMLGGERPRLKLTCEHHVGEDVEMMENEFFAG